MLNMLIMSYRTIWSLVSPLILSCRFKSLTEIETSSSSLISAQGVGDKGA